MAKYLCTGSYTSEGVKGVIADGGTKRVLAVKGLVESIGGSVESMYFAFGSNDFYIVANLPDHVSAASISLTVNATGGASVEVIVLLTPEEVDRASRLSPAYSPPGT